MKTLYTATVTNTGGRNGHVKSDNSVLDFDVKMPKGLGGENDDYTNPEQLFAAGYAACFGSALDLAIMKSKVKTGTTSVTARVSIGQTENGGYQLAVELDVNIPDVSIEQANELAAFAHQICPYSVATRGNIVVDLLITNG
ncbi:organic hydroperoxide resistance protein [Yeosuana marina]|uniref:organic hydroperoxide resistance protein n=1 Tax=Yeosuana marina TaxID=1565536 RepID=UPI0030EBFBAD|tara:strand:+ start:1261 stop:1683 length:423 start_codon:yes stop_codon:yes gene_type:complete